MNDAFVMGAWGESQGAGDKVMMLADGNGDFTRALGLEMDASKFGMGKGAASAIPWSWMMAWSHP